MFVEVPQKAGSTGGAGSGGGVSSVHAQVKIAAVNRRIMMCFMCRYWVFGFIWLSDDLRFFVMALHA